MLPCGADHPSPAASVPRLGLTLRTACCTLFGLSCGQLVACVVSTAQGWLHSRCSKLPATSLSLARTHALNAAWYGSTSVSRRSVVCCREAQQLRRRPHHSCAMWTQWMQRSPARNPAPCRLGWRLHRDTRPANRPLLAQAGSSSCPAALVTAAQRQQARIQADSSRHPAALLAAAQQQRSAWGQGSPGTQQRQLRQRPLQGWCHCPA